MKTLLIKVTTREDEDLPTNLVEVLNEENPSLLFSTITDKQVVSGYHRPVCPGCQCEMRPETNGVGVLDYASWGPYQLFDADLWKCPTCGKEVVGGFGYNPLSVHYQMDFQVVLDHYQKKGLVIRNNG